jgi:hypothetical protein
MNVVTETLQLARGFIEIGWTKGSTARDRFGAVVAPEDPRACRWCAIGAVSAALHVQRERYPIAKTFDLMQRCRALLLRCVHGADTIAGFNDAQERKEPIIQLFKDAEALSEKEGTHGQC